ncbi:hypothetical protein JI667_14700 [Bacillus sp. NTK074B]|uniref:MauE/DoxX family redox-associated membrane protein n=1 Tax=Bacillus sp. NTK074B TaxID=2802174 RepID=UPI001A8FE166|nr:hypothetical protein [Bacillus sp. NTK074B]
MDFIFNSLIYSIGIIFLTTSFSKIIHYKKSQVQITQYKILPRKLTPVLYWLLLLAEVMIVISFMFNIDRAVGMVLAMVLLLIYSAAIGINILKKNTEISCGCGGLVEKGGISRLTIARNVLLITIIGVLSIHADSISYSMKMNEIVFSLVLGINIALLIGILNDKIAIVHSWYKI